MAIAPGMLRELLGESDYLRIWTVGLCSGICRWLEMLVLGIYAYEVTGSPFLVALLVVLRQAPMILLGSVLGTMADRTGPSTLLLIGQALGVAMAGVMVVAFALDQASFWLIALACIASGAIRTADWPLRRRLIGDIAGKDRLVPALGFDSATNNSTRMIGPIAGGIAFQWLGATGAFALAMGLYVLAVVMIVGVDIGRGPAARGEAPKRMGQELREGFGFAARSVDIKRILSVTLVFNVFGTPFLSMIPVVGSGELNLSPGWIGVLAGLEGAGAFLGALVIAVTAPPIPFRQMFYFGVFGYLVLAFVVGSMGSAVPMAVVMFGVGISASGFSAMQTTLIYSVAPPNMRSRLLGLVAIVIGSGFVGVFNVGLMGEWYGGGNAIRIIATEGVLVLMLVGLTWPQLREKTRV